MISFIKNLSDDSKCTFGFADNACNTTAFKVFFIISLLLHIPFFFVSVRVIRIFSLSQVTKFAPGVLFCIAYASSSLNNIFPWFYPFDDHDQDYKSPYVKLSSIFVEIEAIGIISYINMISKIFVVFDIPIGKYINIYASTCHYIVLILMCVKIIFVYINFSNETDLTKVYLIMEYADMIIAETNYCLSIIALSMAFIFSNVRDFLPKKYIKPLKVIIFSLALNFFICTVIREFWKRSEIVKSKVQIRYPNWAIIIGMGLTIYYHFGFDLNLLFIIFLLSYNKGEDNLDLISSDRLNLDLLMA